MTKEELAMELLDFILQANMDVSIKVKTLGMPFKDDEREGCWIDGFTEEFESKRATRFRPTRAEALEVAIKAAKRGNHVFETPEERKNVHR